MRGQDPKKNLDIGYDLEVEKVGYYAKMGNGYAPIQLSTSKSHELFSNWLDLAERDHVFRYKEKGEEEFIPDGFLGDLDGKIILYDGKIYTIPKGPIPPA